MSKILTALFFLAFASHAHAQLISTETQIQGVKRAISQIVQPKGYSLVKESVSMQPARVQAVYAIQDAIYNPMEQVAEVLGASYENNIPSRSYAYRVSGLVTDGKTNRRFVTYLMETDYRCNGAATCPEIRTVLNRKINSGTPMYERRYGIAVLTIRDGLSVLSSEATFENIVK